MRIRVAHISLQFSDNDKHTTHDLEKLFARAESRKYCWITGTEAGPGSGNTGDELVRIGKEHGFRVWVPSHKVKDGPEAATDCWIAVRKDIIEGDWKTDFEFAFPGSGQLNMDLDGRHFGPKGVVTVHFDSSVPELGAVNIGAAHYITGGRQKGSNEWELNEKLGKKITSWARRVGKGRALVFYGGDQNMLDRANDEPQGDTFFGGPLTSTWDELRKWQNTGHGNIDVIATYNRDGRVKALRTFVLDDSRFHLFTDHFLVEAVLEVAPLEKR